MIKLVDSFLYFNELDLLKARLDFLGPYIDHFVVAEANCDFSGAPKELSLQRVLKELPYHEKIIYCPTTVNFNNLYWLIKRFRYCTRKSKLLWKIQDFQRNSLKVGIVKLSLKENDLILFGDLDEFPNVELLGKFKRGELMIHESYTLRQRLFNYHTKIATKDEAWFGTIVSPNAIFNQLNPHEWRSKREQLPYLESGGYHLSYFMSVEKIYKKIQAIAEVEKLNSYLDLSLDTIHSAVLACQDIFGRDLGFTKVSNALPIQLEKILEKYMSHVVHN